MHETASSNPSGRKLTVDDYMRLPDDGKRYQLIEGELELTPSPATKHQRVLGRLYALLLQVLELKGSGHVFVAPLDVVLDPHNVFQPDVFFVANDHLHIVDPRNVKGPPDLVIEVLSPSTRRTDLQKKAPIYARFGVPSYWVIDPEANRLELFRLESGAYRRVAELQPPEVARPEEFPGLEIDLTQLFAD